jgi:copper chaperone CopZ
MIVKCSMQEVCVSLSERILSMCNGKAWMVLCAALVCCFASMSLAALPKQTAMVVPGLDCPNCAKKVTGALSGVRGVASVKTDREARTAYVLPQPDLQLSPKALWEAVEQIGKRPTRLSGPNGTFTTKPPL